MLGAMAAVQDKGSSINRAAKLFGVPLSTLKDRLSSRIVHGVKPGHVPYLSPEEEDELEEYVFETSAIGYGKTRCQLKQIVEIKKDIL